MLVIAAKLVAENCGSRSSLCVRLPEKWPIENFPEFDTAQYLLYIAKIQGREGLQDELKIHVISRCSFCHSCTEMFQHGLTFSKMLSFTAIRGEEP
jgi:hypothetical protein